jgi:hypothetical protein
MCIWFVAYYFKIQKCILNLNYINPNCLSDNCHNLHHIVFLPINPQSLDCTHSIVFHISNNIEDNCIQIVGKWQWILWLANIAKFDLGIHNGVHGENWKPSMISSPLLFSNFCLFNEGTTSLMWRLEIVARWIFGQRCLGDHVAYKLIHDPHVEFHTTLCTTLPIS